jgi:hypothetical protein
VGADSFYIADGEVPGGSSGYLKWTTSARFYEGFAVITDESGAVAFASGRAINAKLVANIYNR